MLGLTFKSSGKPGFRLLCLGAHSDDIEIGCGGTILRLLEENRDVEVHWVVLSAAGQRAQEAARSADLFLAGAAKKLVVTRDFKDGYFPYVGADIKDFFEQIKGICSPDLVLTHYRSDLHQDHRLVSELTWNTFRDHLILEYEIPKYDGDLGTPNFYVELNRSTCETKIQHLMDCFGTQKDKRWFTEDTFRSMLRLRGMECRASEHNAEAFYCRKARI
jgi:LmbE family N-acetylglucosaminyl deacetylase